MAIKPSNLHIVVDKTDEVIQAISDLSRQRLLVGIPDSEAGRTDGQASNAVIGYAQEFGIPPHLPPRPFLLPTVRDEKDLIAAQFRQMGRLALENDRRGVLRLMNALGLKIASEVKARITAGIPPPLAPSTIAGRLRKTQAGRTALRRGGFRSSTGQAAASVFIPLIDTGQLRNAITYVIRKTPAQLFLQKK